MHRGLILCFHFIRGAVNKARKSNVFNFYPHARVYCNFYEYLYYHCIKL